MFFGCRNRVGHSVITADQHTECYTGQRSLLPRLPRAIMQPLTFPRSISAWRHSKCAESEEQLRTRPPPAVRFGPGIEQGPRKEQKTPNH
ncbi:hypothetical protein AAFF_G00214040 [Aldrovandia affinis]|uniref:Uncharacterized protein n=1 Tax=Aldrovandia affinis TaxID=143900 RepID=A0AAD7W5Q0_9TELE|nr:hypothetical protein AAFF_G00214040 [Aldrovandia affinis]